VPVTPPQKYSPTEPGTGDMPHKGLLWPLTEHADGRDVAAICRLAL